MTLTAHNFFASDLRAALEVHRALTEDPAFERKLGQAVDLAVAALREGGKILLAGNGGSAADAQHLAAELVGRFSKNRKALPAISLSTDTSVLTAIANDFGYEEVFARQVEAHAQTEDMLIVFSTSGRSKNILRALHVAKDRGVKCVGFCGQNAAEMSPFLDVCFAVPSNDTPRIQEGHILLGHVLFAGIERTLFPG